MSAYLLTLNGEAESSAAIESLVSATDPALSDGTTFLFDLSRAASWASRRDPANADVVASLVPGGDDGVVSKLSGQPMAFVGNGFDFSGAGDDGQYVLGPAGALASIHGAASQHFMVVIWAKMPLYADWNLQAAMAPFFCSTSSPSGYQTPEADLLTIGQHSARQVTARRQYNGGAGVDVVTASPASHYGRVTQIAYWRNAAGVGLRLRSPGGTTLSTGAVGSDNTGDFSAKQPRWGVMESFWGPEIAPEHVLASRWRLYRSWIEDLSLSARDPATVLDADYAWVTSRNVFQ